MDIVRSALHKPAMGDALKRMDWLKAGRVRDYLLLLALLNTATLVWLIATSHAGVDRNGFLLGSDFLSFWTTGRMLVAGGDPYDAAAHIAMQRAYYAAADGYTAFFYPPWFLPFCWPLGLFGYFPALVTWLATTGAAYLAAVRIWLRSSAVATPLWLLFLAFPAVTIVLTHGQTAFLVATMLGAGALLVPSRPWLAGVLFGLATIKPQFGVLVPVALMATRQWKPIVAAALTALALSLLVTVMEGPEIWAQWLLVSARAKAAMEAGAVPYGKMVSVFAMLRLIGLPVLAAYVGYAIVAAVIVMLVAFAGIRRGWTPGLGAFMLAAAPLVTPFALDYDLVLLAFPMIWLTGEGLRHGFAPYEKLALFLAFALPAFTRALALNSGISIAPPLLALLVWVIWRRVLANAPGCS